MYKLIIFLLLLINIAYGQTVVQVGCGEYFTGYRSSDGRLSCVSNRTGTPTLTYFTFTNCTYTDGMQYTATAIDNGTYYVVGKDINENLITKRYDTTSTGTAYHPIVQKGIFQSSVGLTSGGNLYYNNYSNVGGGGDALNRSPGNYNTPPTLMNNPSAKVWTDFSLGATAGLGLAYCIATASDSTLWQYSRASLNPTQITFPAGEKVIKTAMISGTTFFVETVKAGVYSLWGWGFYGQLVGGTITTNSPVLVTTAWTSQGAVLPFKEMSGSYGTMHVIDAADHLFNSGCNANGEIGIGTEYPSYYNRPSVDGGVWLWNLNTNEEVTAPTQVLGQFKNIQAATSVCAYMYVQDLHDNLYWLGRNKAYCGGNGLTLSSVQYANYPNNLDWTFLKIVNPLQQLWTVTTANITATQHPLANPGVYKYISTSSTTLDATQSSQQATCTINAYQWTIVSGNGGVITSPASATTTFTGLTTGVYVVRLTVTNSCGLTDSWNTQITVTGVVPINPIDTVRTIFRFIQASNINKHSIKIDWGALVTERTQVFQVLKRTPGTSYGGITGRLAVFVGDSTFSAIDYSPAKGSNFYVVYTEDKVQTPTGVKIYPKYSAEIEKKN